MSQLWQHLSTDPVFAVIALSELAFWLLVVAGLTVRYLLHRQRASTRVLLCVPLSDLLVLGATALDLASGAAANSSHGFAACYLGFSIAFGPHLIRWADQRFAHRFAGGPPPDKPPRYGAAKVRHEWREWSRFALAWAITTAVILVLVYVFGTPDRASMLLGWIGSLGVVGVIWLITFPLWVTVFPPQRPVSERCSDAQS